MVFPLSCLKSPNFSSDSSVPSHPFGLPSSFSFFFFLLSLRKDWIGLERIGLDWKGLDWKGLDWKGLDWKGLDWNGLDWIGLERIGLERIRKDG